MAKKKISFDIDVHDFEKLKLIVGSSNFTQGDFLREAVKESIAKYDVNFLIVYIIENNMLTRKIIDRNKYIIEVDDTIHTRELIDDFNFINSGFLIKDGVKTRFYSKIMV